jgi:hypothetical protein
LTWDMLGLLSRKKDTPRQGTLALNWFEDGIEATLCKCGTN